MPSPRDQVLTALSEIAPLHFAEPWDNVGLIVDPGDHPEFARAFFTIDLTTDTMGEAEELGADLIIAYHPPIFSGLKRLRATEYGEALVVRALRAGLTIYSPHTAVDVAPKGMNDWLAAAVGEGATAPIVPHESVDGAGVGRIVELQSEIDLAEATRRAKKHLGLEKLRVSEAPTGRAIRRVAVCPGSGGSVFENLGDDIDLLITGEMRHHDVFARRERGTHVLLADHTNTERGFLPTLAERLGQSCPGLEVSVSQMDADPLSIV
jgi:dinuclear metal center YbgI/SA1388 family protein